MKHLLTMTLVLSVLLAGIAPAAGQDDATEPHPLLAMLEFVPDTEAVQGRGWAAVRYADFQALYTAEGIEWMRATVDTETLLGLVPLPGMLTRIQAGPEGLQYIFFEPERMAELVGFEWISNVDRSLEFGVPPQIGLVLAGDFDADAVSTALSARGFELTEVQAVPVWHRLEDAQIDMEALEPSDPFGGHLGMAARIAIFPGYLANSRFWEMAEGIIAAAQDEQSSLADHPDYRALAEAITASEGLLVQALFYDGADVGLMPEDAWDVITDPDAPGPTEGYGMLAPYTLAVLADRQEDDDQVHLIGLVYADAAAAESAADELARRIRSFSLPHQTNEVLVERFGAQVASSVYESETTGRAVAVVEVRYPLPDERVDADSGLFITGGLLYRTWVRALMQREFFPLLVVVD